MLTSIQLPVQGFKSFHDLPTPPASRPSPPIAHQEAKNTSVFSPRQSQSPVAKIMSAPHRGLPPPAAMALPPQQQPQPQQQSQQTQHSHPGSGQPHGHQIHHQHQAAHQPPPPPPPPQAAASGTQSWSHLPAPPSQWQGAEEAMRNWLLARAEEEKTKQEEERTKQETLRLEQRRIEADMLRSSLGGGVPPPMIPLVFAGMGGGGSLPQAALEWAQQFMPPPHGHQLQIMGAPNTGSPQHQRDQSSQGHIQYVPPPTQGTNPVALPYVSHPASPNRTRAQSTTSVLGHGLTQGAPHLGLNTALQGGGSIGHPQQQPHPQLQGQPAQQEPSPGIYFHHWQPPTSQASSSGNRPASPTGDASRKRKATGEKRSRSPPQFMPASSSSFPSASRGGHKRQRSDMSWHRPSSMMQERAEESDRSIRERSPAQVARERSRSEAGKHSVSSMLSAEPSEPGTATQRNPGDLRSQHWQAGGPSQHYSDHTSSRASPIREVDAAPPHSST